MLVGVDASDSFVETLRAQRVAGILLALGLGGMLVAAISRAAFPAAPGVGAANDAAGGHVEAIAQAIFTRYVFTFEVVSIVLITAALGALALTHRERLVARRTQAELSVERIGGAHPTPFPSPGVYARHNAVDTPALLPDGTAAEASVPDELRRRGTVRYTEIEQAGAEGGTEDEGDGGEGR
jgi:NADH-quinone oxidoreductase subunit J